MARDLWSVAMTTGRHTQSDCDNSSDGKEANPQHSPRFTPDNASRLGRTFSRRSGAPSEMSVDLGTIERWGAETWV